MTSPRNKTHGTVKGPAATRRFPAMRAFCCLLLLCIPAPGQSDADRDAIRKAITTFNHDSERKSVLAPPAHVPALSRCAQAEASTIYFEATDIHFTGKDEARVQAESSQYGTMILKRHGSAVFTLKRI